MIRGICDIITENIKYFPRVARHSFQSIKKMNTGSDLGYLWLFVKPIMYLLMFYAAIAIGMRREKDVTGFDGEYLVWLASGLFAWFYMQNYVAGGAKCFSKNKLLLKRYNIPVSVIPTLNLMPGLYIHFAMIVLLFVIAILLGVKPCIHWIQIPIYTACMVYFCYMWSLLIGLLTSIHGDFFNFLKSVRPAYFWLSGIFFNSRLKEGIDPRVFYYNPITFPVEGYRNCIGYHTWFWEEPERCKCFMITMLIITVLAVLLYRRVRRTLPEFI